MADTVYSNFSNIASNGYPISGADSSFPGGSFREEANAFTPGGSYLFTELDVALQYFSGDNAVSVDLVSDSGGAPGAVLESWIVGQLPHAGSVAQLSGDGTVVLTGGAQYWIVVTPNGTDTAAGWLQGSPSILGPIAFNQGSEWEVYTFSPQGAFDVQGTVVSPEPDGIALTGIGIFALGCYGRKRRPRQ